MKKLLLPAVALLTFYWPMSCASDGNSTSTTDSVSTVTTETQTMSPAGTTRTHTIMETETYTDLKTGKTFRIKKDDAGNYTTESGDQLTYYYSPSTQDTFYGPTGRWVNNALNYDQSSGYSIDEQRASAQMNDMDAEKVKITDEEYKAKYPNGDKVKITDDETKIKTAEGDKLKANENELKVKTADGAKIKMNENETKIKR